MKSWLAAILVLATGPASAADAAHPVVVELFQSQGCSSCPPANANVLAIAGRPDVLALSWQVTYWDDLGWRDTFGDHAFTARQYDFARRLGHDGVFTPQVVVNGRADTVGSDAAQLAALVRDADRGVSGPSLALDRGRVRVGPATGDGEVWLVRYDPRIVQVAILRGENGGETLPHRNVVRQVQDLGRWTGQYASFALPPTAAGLQTAVLIQSGRGGPIIAALRGPSPTDVKPQ